MKSNCPPCAYPRPEDLLVTDSDDDGFVLDAGTIDKVEITDAGFLRAPARITRTGVFVYRNADGTLRRELRHPDEVFAADSLRTLALVPVTREHPQPLGVPVTRANRRDLDVGVVGSDVRRDGEHVAATVQIEDSLAIEDVKSGKRAELSAGYNRVLDRTPGVWNGVAYDAVQRRIRYNHVAITESGRAGPDSRVCLDSRAAVLVCDASEHQDPQEPITMKRKIKLGGITYEVDCEDSAFQALEQEQTRISSLDSRIADLAKERDTAKAKADAAEAEAKKAKDLVTDATSGETFHKAVKARIDLERTAAPLLVDSKTGKAPELAELSDEDIKRKVILVADSEAKLEGASAAYLDGRFDAAVKTLVADSAAKTKRGQGALRQGTHPTPQPGAGKQREGVVADASDSRGKLREHSEKGWEQPLSSSAPGAQQ